MYPLSVAKSKGFRIVRFVFLLCVVLAASQAAGAQTAPEIVRDCPTCLEMIRVKAGSFMMGIPEAESARWLTEDANARPQHRVTFARDFWLGRYPVTREEFAGFVSATNYQANTDCFNYFAVNRTETASWRSPGFRQTERDPVVCVNVADAEAYIDWLSKKTGKTYRLPSEAEWEYAARAGTTTTFYWGDEVRDICRHANISDQSRETAKVGWAWEFDCNDGFPFTSPVGSFRPNPWGLFDMAGNARQWMADCYVEDYSGAPKDGSAWMIGAADCRRLVRGGSWDSAPCSARSGDRRVIVRSVRGGHVGFRLARAD